MARVPPEKRAAAGGGGRYALASGAEYLPEDGDGGGDMVLAPAPPGPHPQLEGEAALLLLRSASAAAANDASFVHAPPRQSSFARARARLRLLEAALCLVTVAVIWVGASVLVQQLFEGVHARLPFFLTYVCVSEFVVLLPLRYVRETTLRAGGTWLGCLRLGPCEPTDWRAAAKAAALVCPLWFLAQSTYNASLGGTSVSSSTVLSTTSCVWTFALSVLFLREGFDWRRLGGVALTLGGAALVSWGDTTSPGAANNNTWWGDALALASALCYGLYTTAIRRLVPDGGTVSLSVFFGFLGAFNSVLLLPLVVGLALGGVEDVGRVTPSFVGWVLAKGLFDNVLSDVIWAHAIVISSATLATVGLALTIPLAMLAELLLHAAVPSPALAGGSALVVAGFVITTVFSGVSGAPTPANDADGGGGRGSGGVGDGEGEGVALVSSVGGSTTVAGGGISAADGGDSEAAGGRGGGWAGAAAGGGVNGAGGAAAGTSLVAGTNHDRHPGPPRGGDMGLR
jgi:solute carrier family 35, member F5